MMASTFIFPTSEAEPILKWMQEIHASVSIKVEMVVIGQTVPELEGVSGSNIPVIIVHALTFDDTEEESRKSLAPFENCPVMEKAYVKKSYYFTNFKEQFDLQLEANPEEHRWSVNSAWLEGSPENVSKTLSPAFITLPNPKAFSLWYSMAPLRPIPDTMAFSLQTDIYFASYVLWEDENEDEHNKTWLKNIMNHIEPITAGQYLGDSDFRAHGRKFVSDANYQKIQQIRAKRDPKRLFHSYLANPDTVINKNDFEINV